MLSCHKVGREATADGCLVVHKDPDGFDVCVLLYPLPGMVGGLEDAKQLCIIDFHISSQTPHGL